MTTTAPTIAPAQATEEIQDAGHVDVLIPEFRVIHRA